MAPEQHGPNYKPASLRWPFLTILLLSICGLAAFLEHAHNVLSAAEDRPDIERYLGHPVVSTTSASFRAMNTSQPQATRVAAQTVVARSPVRREAPLPTAKPLWPLANGTTFNVTRPTTARINSTDGDMSVQVLDIDIEMDQEWRRPMQLYRQPGWYAKEELPIYYMYAFRPETTTWDDVNFYTCGGPKIAPAMCECDFITWFMYPDDLPPEGRPEGSCPARAEMMNTDWPCAPDPETAHSIYAAQAAAFYACAASFGVDFHQTAYDTSGVPTSTWEPQIYTYHIPPPATTTIVEVTRLFEEVTQLPDGRIEVRTNKATLYVAEPAVWQTAAVVTLTNSLGQPTATTTSFPRGVIGDKITQTLRNPEKGVPTATITTIIPFSTTVLTLTNSAGQPTATVTEYATFPDAPSAIRNVRMPQRGDYFIGSFLPVLLTTLLSIAIEAVDAQLKVLLPFHALTRPGGSRAKNSMSMQTDGPSARLNDVLLIFQFRDPISFLGDLLVISSAILTAMSSEVIGMEWFGTCGGNSYYGCFMVLAIYKSRARIVEGLLVFMAVAVALLGILLFRWRTGVAGPPWSIASVAALLSESPDMREVFQGVRAEGSGVRISEEQFKEQLEGKMFALGPAGSGMQYGITVCSVRKRVASGEKKSTMNDKEAIVSEREIGVSDDDASSFAEPPQSRTKSRMSCFSIHSRLYDYLVQGFLLIILCATLAVVLRYDTVTEYSPFETFMDSQTFGVRFLFTAVGVVITFLWEYLFSRISTINPYQRLSKRPQTARSSILLSPTNTVVGSLTNALFDRDIFAASIALATLLSKFTPIILSNIPYKVTQTWMTHVVCGWMTAAILACMILVLLGSILVRFPKMPVEPYTIAKSMYYLCDSHMLRDFEGLATLTQKERNRRIEKMGRRYRFGKMVGVSGETRIGIDYADDGKG